MSRFDETVRELFNYSVANVLREHQLSTEVVKLVPEVLGRTFLESKTDLGISYPIMIRTLDLFKALDRQVLSTSAENSFTMAFFSPTIIDGKVVRGELVVNDGSLVAYSKSIERKGGGRPFTPWKLMGDVAHEMRHAKQYEDDPERVERDYENPYDSRIVEYEANEYAREFVGKQKPWGIMDRIDRAFVLLDLNQDLKRIRKNIGNLR